MPSNSYYISPIESDNDSNSILEVSRSIDENDSVQTSSSGIEYDDFSLDSDDIDICDEICQSEFDHFDDGKYDKKYYIGTCCTVDDNPKNMLSSSISPMTFYKYKFNDVIHYLWLYSTIRSARSKFEIMQLDIDPEYGYYYVILKTFWLRIVQRTWRRIYRERKEKLNKRKSITALRHREITGKFPIGIRVLPTIEGSLRELSKDDHSFIKGH
jgi:hypothetical protein